MTNEVKPFEGLTVVNAGFGLAPALIGKFFLEFGARVIRLAPAGGDPFAQVYPAYEILRAGEEAHPLAAWTAGSVAAAARGADLRILGGEDHPALPPRVDPASLPIDDPRLVTLDIGGYPAGLGAEARPATEILVQARGGMCYEHYSDRPNFVAFQPANYGAAFQGMIGALGALYDRLFSGRGQRVSTSLYEGTLSWLTWWATAEKPTTAFDFYFPRDPKPIILPTADGQFVHITLGAVGSKARLYAALGIDEPGMRPDDSGMPRPEDGPELFFGDLPKIAPYVRQWKAADLLERLGQANVAADVALPPGGCWDGGQIKYNGIIVEERDGTRHVGNPIRLEPTGAVENVRRPSTGEPLSGRVVVDFGAFVAGPFASVPLGDLGADVIKVEPITGDPMRGVFRGFASSNRGKRSIALDMKTAEGAAIAKRLCLRADAVTSNFKPGASKRLGIDAESLHPERPSLVILDAPGYGPSGPDRDRPAFDPIIQAFCGHEFRAGGDGGVPQWSATAMVDYTGGYLGALASLVGLYHQARTGEGAVLTVPLLNAGVFLLSDVAQLPGGRWLGAEVNDHRQAGFHPAESMYQTADGWIAISVRSDAAAAALVKILALDALEDRELSRWRREDADLIAAACTTWSTEALLERFEAAGIWAEVCRKGMEKQTLADSALRDADVVRHVQHPKYGEIACFGPLYHLERSHVSAAAPSPQLGGHSRAILEELGYAPSEIESLFDRAIVA